MFPWEFTIYWNSCSWMENLLKNKEKYNYFYFFFSGKEEFQQCQKIKMEQKNHIHKQIEIRFYW